MRSSRWRRRLRVSQAAVCVIPSPPAPRPSRPVGRRTSVSSSTTKATASLKCDDSMPPAKRFERGRAARRRPARPAGCRDRRASRREKPLKPSTVPWSNEVSVSGVMIDAGERADGRQRGRTTAPSRVRARCRRAPLLRAALRRRASRGRAAVRSKNSRARDHHGQRDADDPQRLRLEAQRRRTRDRRAAGEAGRLAGFLPSTSITRLLVQIAIAIVTSVIAIGVGACEPAHDEALRQQRRPPRPRAIAISDSDAAAAPARRTDAAATMPPIITHSPCAKLIAPVLLKMTLKPSATSA